MPLECFLFLISVFVPQVFNKKKNLIFFKRKVRFSYFDKVKTYDNRFILLNKDKLWYQIEDYKSFSSQLRKLSTTL